MIVPGFKNMEYFKSTKNVQLSLCVAVLLQHYVNCKYATTTFQIRRLMHRLTTGCLQSSSENLKRQANKLKNAEVIKYRNLFPKSKGKTSREKILYDAPIRLNRVLPFVA